MPVVDELDVDDPSTTCGILSIGSYNANALQMIIKLTPLTASN